MIAVGQKSTSPRPIVQILKQLSKIILKTMEMMKSSFAAVTSRQNKVAASKKGIVTKHIAKWVVLGFLAILGEPKWHFGCLNQNSKTTFQQKCPPKTPIQTLWEPYWTKEKWFWAIFLVLVIFPLQFPLKPKKITDSRRKGRTHGSRSCAGARGAPAEKFGLGRKL